MSLILTSRPILKETPRNRTAPAINPRLQETLTRIGGTVPASGGKYAGMPNWRLAFGQEETHFCRGKQRVRFPDPNVVPITVQERFFVSPEVFSRASRWIKQRDEKRRERCLNFDYSVFAEYEPISNYLKEHESSLDYIQLKDEIGTAEEIAMDAVGIASTVAPANWIYVCDVKDIIEIGKNCWYVMLYIPASSHGGRRQWHEMRYTQNAFIPELNDVVPLVDDLGEFPEYGFWIPRLEIAEYPEDEDGNMSAYDYQYLDPSEANTIEPVLEMLQERERLTNQDKDRSWRAKVNEENLVKKRDEGMKRTREHISKLLGVDVDKIK